MPQQLLYEKDFHLSNREKALHPDGWKACWGKIADRLLVQQ